MDRPHATLGALALAGLAAAGAASASDFECPDRGGPEWREVRTAHFIIATDLSSGKAKDLAEELERMHEVVRHGLFRSPPESGVIRVAAFRSEEEFDLFAPRGAVAYYAPAIWAGPTIVMYGVGADRQRVAVAHEITHHVTARAFARRPIWFNEGLACVMESTATVGTPTVGGVPRWRLNEVYPYFGEVARVLRAKTRLETSRDYGVAWALVHFLMNNHPQEFASIQQRFGRGEDPATAWRAVFPQWNPASDEAMAALDKEIGKYVARGQFRERPVKLPEAPAVSERPMTAAEAHEVRLSLPWANRGKKVDPDRLRAEVEETLGHDPGSVMALRLSLEGKSGQAAAAMAERATTAHPDDARAWLLLGSVAPPEQREAALRKAVQFDSWGGAAHNELAWHLLQTGRPAEALPFARRAVELAPGSSPYLDTLAGVAEANGHCQPGLAIQRRAVDLLPEGLDEKGRAPYMERLARLEKGCGGAAPAGPSPPADAGPSGESAAK